jgi:hypothetical protein
MTRTLLIIGAALLLSTSLPSWGVTTINQLDSIAVFHFAIMSDNKGAATENVSLQRCDSWVRNKAEFVLGLGDNLENNPDPFISFIKTDSYWKDKFYPNVADGENQYYSGNQGDWGTGVKIFNEVNNFFGRSNVTFRALTSDADDRKVDYYASFAIKGYKVHLLSLHFSDTYDGSMGPSVGNYGMANCTIDFMVSKLTELKKIKTDKDIILVLAHSSSGDFVRDAITDATKRQLLCTTADLCVSATIHVFQKWDRYTNYGPNAAVHYNSGQCGGTTGSTKGYMEIHVLENPTRIVIQYIDVELLTTRQLARVGGLARVSTTVANKLMTAPYVKQINGPTTRISDWNTVKVDKAVAVAAGGALSSALKLQHVAIAQSVSSVKFVLNNYAGIRFCAKMRIIDASGRTVREISASSPGNFLWDKTDAFGIRVNEGLYFAQLNSNGKDFARSFVMMR